MPTISKNSIIYVPPPDPFVEIFKQHNKRKQNLPYSSSDGQALLPQHVTRKIDHFKESERADFFSLIDKLKDKRSKIAEEKYLWNQSNNELVNAVKSIVKWKLFWVRDVDEWEPKTHNVNKQLHSLITHLFCKYKTPSFMYGAWTSENERHQEWFVNLAQGENLRKQNGLPIPITKMMAHHFSEAPSHFSVLQAIRWGQLLSMNIDRNVATKIISSPMAVVFSDNDFWITVIKFLSDNPFIPLSYYTQIYDYIRYIKFTSRGHFVENGVVRVLGPLQPNFCMKGRTPESLLKSVDAWHKQGQKVKTRSSLYWDSCGIKPFSLKRKDCYYEITELMSSTELRKEADAMGHCVWSYDVECHAKKSAIFSMRKYDNEHATSGEIKLTIQVRLHDMFVVQARKRWNAKMGGEEANILMEWARKSNLKIATYL